MALVRVRVKGVKRILITKIFIRSSRKTVTLPLLSPLTGEEMQLKVSALTAKFLTQETRAQQLPITMEEALVAVLTNQCPTTIIDQ